MHEVTKCELMIIYKHLLLKCSVCEATDKTVFATELYFMGNCKYFGLHGLRAPPGTVSVMMSEGTRLNRYTSH